MLDEYKHPRKIFVLTACQLVRRHEPARSENKAFAAEVARALTILAAGARAEAGADVDARAMEIAEQSVSRWDETYRKAQELDSQ